jgi:hypothetical protein
MPALAWRVANVYSCTNVSINPCASFAWLSIACRSAAMTFSRSVRVLVNAHNPSVSEASNFSSVSLNQGVILFIHAAIGTPIPREALPNMEKHDLRTYLKVALQEPEIRRACRAVDRIITAGDLLDHMSPTALEVVKDYCTEQTRNEKGTYSEFRQAWIKLVVDHLNDAKTLERRLYHGLTGVPPPTDDGDMKKHELKRTATVRPRN